MNAPPPPPPLPPVPPPLPPSGGLGHNSHPMQHQQQMVPNNSITTLSKLNPTSVILTHIPPFLRHPRNLRDLLYSTTSIKHLFYSCPIKRFSNDNSDDDKNENVVAVVKFTHSGNALSIIRNWMNVRRKLNEEASASTNKKNGSEDSASSSKNSNNNGGELSYCNMNAFLLYSDGHISLHPEKSKVDAGMIESIWDLTHKKRDTTTDTGKVAQQADDNMTQSLVDAYRSIEKRQKELDVVAAANEGDAALTSASNHGGGIGSNPTDGNIDGHDITSMSEEETKLKLDSAKVRAAAGGGAYDDEADPLNAPEVLEAVKQFKKKLEITQGGFRRKRKEYVAKRLKEEVKKAKERLIQQRKAMEKRIVEQQQPQQQMPPPPLPPMNLPPPPVPPGGMPPPPQQPSSKAAAKETSRRGVSNLPAWMTAGKSNKDNDDEGKKRSADEIAESGNGGGGDDEPSRKKKFIPSEANRDFNTRKERLVVGETGGETSLAAIRAANEAADKAKRETEEKALKEKIQEYLNEASAFSDEQILAGIFPKLHLPETIPTIRSFVKEQMVEYLGEEEATLIDFIMKYLVKHDSSSSEDNVKGKAVAGLLEEMKMVLEEDADPFVVDLFKKILELESK